MTVRTELSFLVLPQLRVYSASSFASQGEKVATYFLRQVHLEVILMLWLAVLVAGNVWL